MPTKKLNIFIAVLITIIFINEIKLNTYRNIKLKFNYYQGNQSSFRDILIEIYYYLGSI